MKKRDHVNNLESITQQMVKVINEIKTEKQSLPPAVLKVHDLLCKYPEFSEEVYQTLMVKIKISRGGGKKI